MEEKITTEELDTADKKDPKFNILNYVKQYKKMILVIGCAVIAAIALLIGVISIANSIKAEKIEKQLQGMVFKHYSEYNVDSGENSVTNWYLWVIDIDKDDSYISEDWSCYPAESEDKRFKHSKYEYELDISFSLFGKPQLGRYEIVYDENGEYSWCRDFETIKKTFEWELNELKTDYVDFGFLHCVDDDEDFDDGYVFEGQDLFDDSGNEGEQYGKTMVFP